MPIQCNPEQLESFVWSGAAWWRHSTAGSVEDSVRALLAQRIFGLAPGYEDLTDHDTLRSDPVFGVLVGKLAEPLAGKSTLNRLQRFAPQGVSRYHRIRPDAEAIVWLFVELFLDSDRSTLAPAAAVITDRRPFRLARNRMFFEKSGLNP